MHDPENKKNTKLKYTLLICTLGDKLLLSKCIASVAIQNHSSYEVLIVDQGPYSIEAELNFDGVKNVRYFNVNFKGLSKARNYGIRQSLAEYIVFLDDDGILEDSFLLKLDDVINEKGDVTAFAGIVLDDITKKPIGRSIKDQRNLEIDFLNYNQWMSSATVIKRSVLQQINGYDEQFGAGAKYGGSEDTDVLLRLLAGNNKAFFSKDLIVYHPCEKNKLSEFSFKQCYRRGYSYGYGRGACLKKATLKFSNKLFIKHWYISLIFGITGCGYSILRLNAKMFLKDFASFWGRVNGYIGYSGS